ncbi:MAG TPA: DNA polymerase III subunit chi [Burkholderiaceae bacterium]|nr:DNA polymerase III subunit chi [Burkholderiaceae bacterium]
MTEVSFHFNVADRTDYTCRLVRKATRAGASVVLAGPALALQHFDRALWTFDDLEFIPHVMQSPGQPVAARLRAATQVWLLQDAGAAPQHDVLVNLGTEAPAGFESFAKLIEIVTPDEGDRSAARLRWKHYAARGYAIRKHEVAAGVSS